MKNTAKVNGDVSTLFTGPIEVMGKKCYLQQAIKFHSVQLF